MAVVHQGQLQLMLPTLDHHSKVVLTQQVRPISVHETHLL